MQSRETDNGYIVILERGEELRESVVTWAKERGIESGQLRGIGAVSESEFGYYSLEKRVYHFKKYTEMLEVLALQGNIALVDGEPFVHVHGVFSGTDNNAIGGHIERAVTGLTLELYIQTTGSSVHREYDEFSGLKLCGL